MRTVVFTGLQKGLNHVGMFLRVNNHVVYFRNCFIEHRFIRRTKLAVNQYLFWYLFSEYLLSRLDKLRSKFFCLKRSCTSTTL
jgi:hypothetical protein